MGMGSQDIVIGLIVAIAFFFILRYALNSIGSLRRLSKKDGPCNACGCGAKAIEKIKSKNQG